VTSRPIEKFFQQNPGIKKLPLPDVLLDNDEVCYLEAPKMIDPGELLGKVINFVDKTKIKINRTKYVIEPSLEDIKPLTILTKNLKVIHPVAFLRFREYSKRKKESGSVESEQFAPSFPDNLKVRHPLFGAQYEDKIALDEEIQKKLDNTIDQFVKKKKREKKKEQDEDINQELISTISEFDSFRNESEEEKNKKKQKINVINNIIIPSHQFRQEAESLSLEGDSFQKKKKKHKKEKKAEEMRLKPNASLETTDFEIHDEHSLQLPTFEFDISSIMSKEECAVENDAITQENVTKVSPKKQKNQNESLDNSVINDDSRKKKKKKRQKSDDEDSEVSPKKKHKKDKEENEETTNSLILDILSRVKSEMDTSSMKHKKKKRSD
ncbi:hypothetical protein BDFB_004664, partial [Asbolus verrucosus]